MLVFMWVIALPTQVYNFVCGECECDNHKTNAVVIKWISCSLNEAIARNGHFCCKLEVKVNFRQKMQSHDHGTFQMSVRVGQLHRSGLKCFGFCHNFKQSLGNQSLSKAYWYYIWNICSKIVSNVSFILTWSITTFSFWQEISFY